MYNTYRAVELPDEKGFVGTGWLPPLPDLRDFTAESPEVESLMKPLKISLEQKPQTLKALPLQVDLKQWCSPIENQGSLGSCTAHAAIGIVEYYEKRVHGKYVDASRLFVYHNTRRLMGVPIGVDSGAWLRTTMGALAHCGAPPEKYWPYTDKKPDFDALPTCFVYAVGDDYRAIKYFCHDPWDQNISPQIVLDKVKLFLAHGLPSMFGFFGFPSFNHTSIPGGIPYPCPGENAQWGHAIVAVGYDDNLKITNTKCNKSTKGALLIRNSWGTGWGNQGYGWLPYDYVLNKLALDFWSLAKMDWIDPKIFKLQ